MRKQGPKSKMLLVLLAVAGLAIFPTQGWAQLTAEEICDVANSGANIIDPSGDYDGDGFTNCQECWGLVASDETAYTNWPGFLPDVPNPENKVRLDPTKVNLYVIVRSAPEVDPTQTYTHFPDDKLVLLEHVSKLRTEGGLEIVPLLIGNDQVGSNEHDRAVTLPGTSADGCLSLGQKAVRITESLKSLVESGDKLGECYYGTVNYKDRCVIYTAGIREFIFQKCPTDDCIALLSDGTQVEGYENVVAAEILHVVAHEIGHTLCLALTCSRKTGLCHDKSFMVVMEPYSQYKGDQWRFGTIYTESSQEGFRAR